MGIRSGLRCRIAAPLVLNWKCNIALALAFLAYRTNQRQDPILRFQAKEQAIFTRLTHSSSTTSANPFSQQPPRWCKNAPDSSSVSTTVVYVSSSLSHVIGPFESFSRSPRSVYRFIQGQSGHGSSRKQRETRSRNGLQSSRQMEKRKSTFGKIEDGWNFFSPNSIRDSAFDTRHTTSILDSDTSLPIDHTLNEPTDQSETRTGETWGGLLAVVFTT